MEEEKLPPVRRRTIMIVLEAARAASETVTGAGPGILRTWTTEATMRRSKLSLTPLTALAIFSVTAPALLFVAEPAEAQQSTTRGFTVGLHLTAASLSVEGGDDERNNAGGGGLYLGYGVNRRITIFVQGDGGQFDNESTDNIEGEWTMGHFDVGVRFNFANSLRKWVPFLQGALGYRVVGVDNPVVDDVPRNELSISGSGLTLGGGVDFYLSESWALDLQLLWTGGKFTTLRVDEVSVNNLDFDANSSRLNLGVSWWP